VRDQSEVLDNFFVLFSSQRFEAGKYICDGRWQIEKAAPDFNIRDWVQTSVAT
jgi:hypothetical protein